MKARIQAHGATGDVMRGYGLAHIPEGENIFLGDRYQVNLRHRRLASSAAHLYGKPLASSETYTWLRTPLFTTTLEQMKPATDAVLLDGINHIVNHGYSYSPAQAGEPGWAFYASTEANHTNTWWRHYPHLARYVPRACALLQQGVSVNPVAVYLPMADLYAQFGAGSLHIDVEAEGLSRRPPQRPEASGLRLRPRQRPRARSARPGRGGRARAGTARYSVVIVPGARFMPPESLERLAELARAGGHVIFAGRVPEGAAGLERREDRRARVKRALGELFAGEPRMDAVARPGRGTAALVSSTDAVLRSWDRCCGPTSCRRAERRDARRAQGGARERRLRPPPGRSRRLLLRGERLGTNAAAACRLRRGASRAVALGPRDRRGAGAARVRVHGGRGRTLDGGGAPPRALRVLLRRLRTGEARGARDQGSLARPSRDREARRRCRALRPFARGRSTRGALGVRRHANGPRRGSPGAHRDPGPWTLRLGEKATLTLHRLVSWDQLDEGRAYSGWASYEAEFELGATPADVEWLLDLGTVHETAEASLNGTGLGAAWKGLRRLACGSALRPGRNRLKVDVANLWIHHVAASPAPDWRAVEESFGIRWGRYGEVKPEKIPPAGLLGPVRLVPLRRVRLRL